MTKIISAIYMCLFSLSLFAQPLTEVEFKEILTRYRQKMGKISDPHEKFKLAIASMPEDELYKFFIDKKRLQNPDNDEINIAPHLLFDIKEPGYFKAMLEAFKSLPNYISREISVAMNIELHDKAIDQVKDKNGYVLSKGISGQYCYCPAPYFSQDTATELYNSAFLFGDRFALDLLGEEIASDSSGHLMDDKNYINKFMKKKFSCIYNLGNVESIIHTQKEWEILFTPLLAHFRASIEHTKTLNGIVSAAGELLRALEVAHIFPDGNTRTNAFLLLNKILIENNLPPVILEEPNMFGYLTVKELAQQIRLGMMNFLNQYPDFHRNFVNEHLSDIPIDNGWFDGDDYVPYHQDARPLNKLIKNFYKDLKARTEYKIANGLISRYSEEEHSDLYFAIIFGQSELVGKLLSNGAQVNSSLEYYPLTLSLASNYKMFPIILKHYQTMNHAWSDAKNHLVEAIDFLRNYPFTGSETYLEQLFELVDPNDPLVPLLRSDMQAFLVNIKADPHILFDMVFHRHSLIDYFMIKFKQHDDYAETWQNILDILLAQVEDLSPSERALLLPFLCQEIKRLHEPSIQLLSRIIQGFPDEKQPQISDRDNPFFVLVKNFVGKRKPKIEFEQFNRIFNILVDSGFKPNLVGEQENTLLHYLIESSNLATVCRGIHRNSKLGVEEKMVRYNLIIDNIVNATQLIIKSGIYKQSINDYCWTLRSLLCHQIDEIEDKVLELKGSPKIKELENLFLL